MSQNEHSPAADREEDRRRLGQKIGGYQATQLIYTAARLALADRLRDGPRGSGELARLVGADAGALRRLMRALVAIDVLVEEEDGRFRLTPQGQLLREDVPGSLRATALMHGGLFYQAWGALPRTARTGETAFETVFGAPLFGYLDQHPDAGEEFDRFMAGVSTAIAEAVTAGYDFSPFHTVVDVGGGHGTLLAAILNANPHLTGVLFDLPAVIERARERLQAESVAGRCALVGGDFFDAVPQGGDAYLLKWILHDWDDARCLRILRNCRAAMRVDAKLLIVEELLPERVSAGSMTAYRDMLMMVVTGGRERTEAEYRALLAAAGFPLVRVIELPVSAASPVSGARMSVIEAVPQE